MSKIKAKDTLPELMVRSELHRLGFRFRLHRKDLPGRPDIILPRFRIAIFVHGCFWHQHEGCGSKRIPETNAEKWAKKLALNIQRDTEAVEKLSSAGWKVYVFWECEIKKDLAGLISLVSQSIRN